MQLHRLVPLLLVLLVSTQALAAPRDRDKERARDFARHGNTAYNLGKFEEAARQYEKAYRLVQDPNLLFNVAQSYRLAEKTEEALAAYKGFLRTAPTGHPKRPQAQERLAELEAARAQAPPAATAPSSGAPGTVTSAPPAESNDFNPFSSKTEPETAGAVQAAGDEGGEVTSDNLIRRTNPTAGGLLMFADQGGISSDTVTHFQVFVRAKHEGRKYEGGYFHLPIFAPNPLYTTSAVYFRFTSAKDWWAQAGALGKDGNYHLGGGIDWPFLSMAARLENVGGLKLCNATNGSALYIVPEAALRLPLIKGLKVGVLGSFRQSLVTDSCVFHPSMANVDGEVDWAVGESLVLRGGLGVYQFFGTGTTAQGGWGDYDKNTAPHAYLGARYQWRKHIAVLGSYRRFFYAGGLNQLVFAIEASLGEL